MELRRVILIVLDSVGIGEAPDAALYGDEGSNTLVNTATSVGGLHLPHLARAWALAIWPQFPVSLPSNERWAGTV